MYNIFCSGSRAKRASSSSQTSRAELVLWLGCLTSRAEPARFLNEPARARSSRAELARYPPLVAGLNPVEATFVFFNLILARRRGNENEIYGEWGMRKTVPAGTGNRNGLCTEGGIRMTEYCIGQEQQVAWIKK